MTFKSFSYILTQSKNDNTKKVFFVVVFTIRDLFRTLANLKGDTGLFLLVQNNR